MLHATVYAHARRRQPAHGSRQPRALHAHGQADARDHGDGRGGSAGDAGSDTQTGAVLVTTFVSAEAGAIAKGSAGMTVSTGVFDASFLRSHGFPLPTSAPAPTSVSPTSVLKAVV